jgi:hypothetical protein
MFTEASTALFATASPEAQTAFWVICGVAAIGYGLWQLWMKTFRTEQWLKLQEAEEEKKKRRDERIKATLGGASLLAKILMGLRRK